MIGVTFLLADGKATSLRESESTSDEELSTGERLCYCRDCREVTLAVMKMEPVSYISGPRPEPKVGATIQVHVIADHLFFGDLPYAGGGGIAEPKGLSR